MFNTVINWSVAAILASFTIMPISLNRQSAPAVGPNKEETALKGCAVKQFDDLYQFKFTGDDYEDNTVKDVGEWEYIGNNSHNCNDEIDQQACVIWVPESKIIPADLMNPIRLSNSLVLTTDSFTPDFYYVTGAVDVEIEFYNEEHN